MSSPPRDSNFMREVKISDDEDASAVVEKGNVLLNTLIRQFKSTDAKIDAVFGSIGSQLKEQNAQLKEQKAKLDDLKRVSER